MAKPVVDLPQREMEKRHYRNVTWNRRWWVQPGIALSRTQRGTEPVMPPNDIFKKASIYLDGRNDETSYKGTKNKTMEVASGKLSSLQQAVKTGSFEVSFASGLDLSELQEPDNKKTDGATNNSNPVTAALQLLQQKAQESLLQQNEEQQDASLLQLAKAQAEGVAKAISKTPSASYPATVGERHNKSNLTRSDNPFDLMKRTNLMDTLLGMHQVDRSNSDSNIISNGGVTRNNHGTASKGNSINQGLLGSLSRRALEKKAGNKKNKVGITTSKAPHAKAIKKSHRSKY